MAFSYGRTIAGNIAGVRARKGLKQSDVVERMNSLGYSDWHRQTLSRVERSDRRIQAEELLGLAIVLETSVTRLLAPVWEDKHVELPNGMPLGVIAVEGYIGGEWVTDERILWHGNKPVYQPRPGTYADEDD
jgi:transcriptional regulator with XRE-family HTH domain